MGFNHNEHGVLQCPALRLVVKPADCMTYDFMHCFLSNGVADYESQLYWKKCLSLKLLTLAATCDWMECLHWPKNIKTPRTMWAGCHTQNLDEHDLYGGGAGALLSFYPTFRDMVLRVMPNDVMVAETKSLLALFRAVDGWSVYLHRKQSPPGWQDHIKTWMELLQAASPDSAWSQTPHY